ncbi:putative transcriptional regulator, TetR family protein [Actinomycetospora sp. NBRC 106375]|uniref:TetR-like C-terminal domain-containing protein n=1 Tax=Actinomycetospora sp. NBRC 106375 TaxID=3032207 RepID=UPI0024A5DF74|nr:TetR-like C-terminal domain-containing protein [Actinomycetospora sp. NBRC 106375]GLZ47541.1 putative transcriptional regulator, TetR family protein [Actinomycetospora sp. NBRC 106375]
METGERRERRGRGRRPADEVRGEVLSAAAELLLAEGMGGFTFERVSAVSGASRTTLHKWWPSRGALALEAYFRTVESTLAFPDTGDIAADLTEQVTAFVRLMTRTAAGRVIAELIGSAQTDPELAGAYREHYSAPRRALAVAAVEQARDRGELRADVDAEAVVDQLWGACYHRLLIPDQPLTEAFARTLVDQLVHGIGRG